MILKSIKLNDIIIPEYMKAPSLTKYEIKCMAYRNGEPLSPVIINEDNVLVDGYISYLIFKNDGLNNIGVMCNSNDSYKTVPTVYVEGVHLNSECDTAYTWRLTNKFIEDNNITDEMELIGKKALVQTKFGLAPIKIINVKYLDSPPVEGRIKKVCKIIQEN